MKWPWWMLAMFGRGIVKRSRRGLPANVSPNRAPPPPHGGPAVSGVKPERPAVDPELRRSMVLLRHSIDQTLAQVRDGLDAMGEEKADAYIEAIAAAASEYSPLCEPRRMAARMQYVAVQMVALESAEAKVAGGSR